jgi:cytochrome c biogenesis protein CcdA
MCRRCVGLSLLLAAGLAQAALEFDPPACVISPPLLVGQSATRLVTVRNTGPGSVTIGLVAADGKFGAGLAKSTLAPGERTQLTISLPAFAAPRVIAGRVRLELADGSAAAVLGVSGQVVAGGPSKLLPPEVSAGPYRAQPDERPVRALVFFNSGCGHCVEMITDIIDPLARHFGQWVVFERHDLLRPEEYALVERLKRAYGLKSLANTYVFVGRHALAGDVIDRELYGVLRAELRRPTPAPPVALSTAGWSLPGVAALLLAGILDGLNPCAFATAVFLIALLTRLGHDRRTLLAAGAAFTLAVFVTYTLLGLGLIAALSWWGNRVPMARALRSAVAAIALVCALLHLVDLVRLRRGAPTREMSAQLPLPAKQAIHAVLRRATAPVLGRVLITLAAAAAGAVVTLIEMICTSQVYLPVLAALQSPALHARALRLLLVYNVGFVLPLIAVLIAAWRGTGSDRLARCARRHFVASKLALAGLLVALAAWLVFGPR